MCELYKNQLITIRVTSGNIFYGPMKVMYQTFYDRVIEVFYNGEWFPAKIIGKASVKEMYQVNRNLTCSADLKLKTPSGIKDINNFLSDMNTDIRKICLNTNECRKITSVNLDHDEHIDDIEFLNEKSDWLFGVKFEDPKNQYYTLTDGYIVSVF